MESIVQNIGALADTSEEELRQRIAEHDIFALDRQDPESAIILCHFNPARFRNPLRNVLLTLDYLLPYNTPVFAAEITYTDQVSFPIFPAEISRNFQHKWAISQKETLWNYSASRLPESVKNLIFLDADLVFSAPQWIEDISRALEKHPIAQPFSQANWTGPKGRKLYSKPSIGSIIQKENRIPNDPKNYHPGFAAAFRREVFEAIHGLHFGPVGGGDIEFILAAIGQSESMHPVQHGYSENAWQSYRKWASRVSEIVDGDIGCIDCEVFHLWHGSGADRQYVTRNDLLKGYDPSMDISSPTDSIPYWSDYALKEKSEMVQNIHRHFSSRKEDDNVVRTFQRSR